MDVLVPERCDFRVGDVIRGSGNTHYCIEKQLGEGTFGIVYKVKDNEGRTCALKLLKLWTVPSGVYKGMKDRFVMEFETGKIKSNYLAHSYAYGDVNNNPFFVMEFCPNGDLGTYAKNKSVDFAKVGTEILCGLRDLHNEGKVHRDLKPENVLLRDDYTAVLTDFGISGDQNKRMTERGIAGKPKQLFGTYPYMPPEQVNPPRGGKATVLPTTDIFSFGVMMYEMMVGKLPFGELVKDEQLYSYLEHGKNGIWDREALRRVDNTGRWTPVIERCLDPDYKTRIASATQVIEMLPRSNYAPPVEPSPTVNRSFMSVKEGLMLRVMQGNDYGKTFRLKDYVTPRHQMVTLGRADITTYNDIALRDDDFFLSRCHCTFEYDNTTDQWIVRDGQWRKNCPIALRNGSCANCNAYCRPEDKAGAWRDSTNGTYLNSSEVGQYGMIMNPGDIITVGDVKLRVEGY